MAVIPVNQLEWRVSKVEQAVEEIRQRVEALEARLNGPVTGAAPEVTHNGVATAEPEPDAWAWEIEERVALLALEVLRRWAEAHRNLLRDGYSRAREVLGAWRPGEYVAIRIHVFDMELRRYGLHGSAVKGILDRHGHLYKWAAGHQEIKLRAGVLQFRSVALKWDSLFPEGEPA